MQVFFNIFVQYQLEYGLRIHCKLNCVTELYIELLFNNHFLTEP